MDMDNLPENITEKSVENCVGRYIMADVRHSEYNGRVFDHLDSYSIEPAEGYTGEETEEEDTVDEEDTDEDEVVGLMTGSIDTITDERNLLGEYDM